MDAHASFLGVCKLIDPSISRDIDVNAIVDLLTRYRWCEIADLIVSVEECLYSRKEFMDLVLRDATNLPRSISVDYFPVIAHVCLLQDRRDLLHYVRQEVLRGHCLIH